MRSQLLAYLQSLRAAVAAMLPALMRTLSEQTVALIASLLGVLKTSATAKVADAVGDIGGAFGWSDTALDKRRIATADQLGIAARAGDMGALRQLLYSAYEPRKGLPGDVRTPVDGKMSPRDVRNESIGELKATVAALGGLPPEFSQYTDRLNTGLIPQSRLAALQSEALDIVRVGVQQGAVNVAQDKAIAAAKIAKPWALIGAVIIGGVVVFKLIK